MHERTEEGNIFYQTIDKGGGGDGGEEKNPYYQVLPDRPPLPKFTEEELALRRAQILANDERVERVYRAMQPKGINSGRYQR